jgi:hypothetical protein
MGAILGIKVSLKTALLASSLRSEPKATASIISFRTPLECNIQGSMRALASHRGGKTPELFALPASSRATLVCCILVVF